MRVEEAQRVSADLVGGESELFYIGHYVGQHVHDFVTTAAATDHDQNVILFKG